MDIIFLRFYIGFYFLAAVTSFTGAFSTKKWLKILTPILAAFGFAFHFAAIHQRGVSMGRFPLSNLHEFLCFLSWAIILVYLISYIRYKIDVLGTVLIPMSLVLLFTCNMLVKDVIPIPSAQQPIWFLFHVTVATLGVAALFLAFAGSLFYLLQDHILKKRKRSHLFKFMPSIESCDRIGFQSLLWGFALLTLAIISGAVWSANVRNAFWVWQTKETFSLVAWIIVAVALYARLVKGWRGKRSAYLTILGFMAGLIIMFGVNP
ncbi:MAG: cytochrome c biogenesis protein CcsA [Acidobacteriota bacterium]